MARISHISVDKIGLQAGRVDGWRESIAGCVLLVLFFRSSSHFAAVIMK